ncbi:hypothetical protein [Nafulsella turpanensis]|uniref:hypothetical protein n=1 Tax=Nafulsella turpanensis TaxID=1265690 RepID=UPI00034973EB|nr:hypothetical protein [Nafulsella turpanensis]
MTDQEFDVMDELYFVQSFAELQQSCQLEAQELKQLLLSLIRKEWVRWMIDRADEAPSGETIQEEQMEQYYYLATKAGLLAHNSR